MYALSAEILRSLPAGHFLGASLLIDQEGTQVPC